MLKVKIKTALEWINSIRSIENCNVVGKLGYAVAKNKGILDKIQKDYREATMLNAADNKLISEFWPEEADAGIRFDELLKRIDAMGDEDKLRFGVIKNKVESMPLLLEQEEDIEIHMVKEDVAEKYPLNVVSALFWMVE